MVDLAPSQMSGLSQDAVDTRFPLPVMAAHEELSSCWNSWLGLPAADGETSFKGSIEGSTYKPKYVTIRKEISAALTSKNQRAAKKTYIWVNMVVTFRIVQGKLTSYLTALQIHQRNNTLFSFYQLLKNVRDFFLVQKNEIFLKMKDELTEFLSNHFFSKVFSLLSKTMHTHCICMFRLHSQYWYSQNYSQNICLLLNRYQQNKKCVNQTMERC